MPPPPSYSHPCCAPYLSLGLVFNVLFLCWAGNSHASFLRLMGQITLNWKLEVQDQVLIIPPLPTTQRLQGRVCFLLLTASGGCQRSLACSHLPLTSASVFTWPFLRVSLLCVSVPKLPLPLSYLDTWDCPEAPPGQWRINPSSQDLLLNHLSVSR